MSAITKFDASSRGFKPLAMVGGEFMKLDSKQIFLN
jgi:hypothetical protein